MKTSPEQDTSAQVLPVTETAQTTRPPSMAPSRASRGVSLYDPGPGKFDMCGVRILTLYLTKLVFLCLQCLRLTEQYAPSSATEGAQQPIAADNRLVMCLLAINPATILLRHCLRALKTTPFHPELLHGLEDSSQRQRFLMPLRYILMTASLS